MISASGAIKVIDWGVRLCQYVNVPAQLRQRRERKQQELATLLKDTRHQSRLTMLSSMHLGFSHSSRLLAMQMMQEWDRNHMTATRDAMEVCSGARDAMALVTGTSPIHCCIKIIVPGLPARVGTWARSDPEGRPSGDEEEPHLVQTNTVWSALTGESDGTKVWPAGFTCFACNNLPAVGTTFACDRNKWADFYKSVLVFPVRYAKTIVGNEYRQVGFLAFDSPLVDAFPGVPSIFDYSASTPIYREELLKSPAFHIGALFADTLGTFLGAAIEAAEQRKESKSGK
jgi:hypothetical protein